MLQIMAQYWWAVLLRGIVAIIFGIMAFAWPGITLLVLIYLFGAYALVDGIAELINGIRMRGIERQWWIVVIQGIAGIVIGILAFMWPGTTGLVLLYFIAAWAIITGGTEIIAAIRLRQEINNEWLLILSGVLSLIFGFLLIFMPGAGALSVLWLIAIYAIIAGIALVVLSFRLRSLRGQLPAAA